MEIYVGWKRVGSTWVDDVGNEWYEFRKPYDGNNDKLFILKERNSTFINGCTTDITGIAPGGVNDRPMDLFVVDLTEINDPEVVNAALTQSDDWQLYGTIRRSTLNRDNFLQYVSDEIKFAKNRIENTTDQHVIAVYAQYITDIQDAADKELLRDPIDPLYSNLPKPPRL